VEGSKVPLPCVQCPLWGAGLSPGVARCVGTVVGPSTRCHRSNTAKRNYAAFTPTQITLFRSVTTSCPCQPPHSRVMCDGVLLQTQTPLIT
jgi:hypothetical protein